MSDLETSYISASDEQARLAEMIERRNQRQLRIRLAVGAGFIAVGAAVAGGIASGLTQHDNVAVAMPFVPEAQAVVNNIDNVLVDIGEVAFPLALTTIGGVKLASCRSARIASIDKLSSQEMSDDGDRHKGTVKKAMTYAFAGGFPFVATMGSMLGAITTGVGDEVTNGPSRPVVAISQYAPGDAWIVQSKDALPMVDQYLSLPLVSRIEAQANKVGVRATPVDLNLSNFDYQGENRTDLVFGIDMPASSPAAWRPSEGCKSIPLIMDEAANVKNGSEVEIDGINGEVVGQTKDMSAINRIGIIADRQAVKACLEKSADTPDDMVILDTDVATGNQILAAANTDGETATVITKQHYLSNSADFWRSNVKPITNFLALVSGGLALVAMSGTMLQRMLRNRSEWAAKFASKVTDNQMRATELTRAAKDGVVASVGGVALATGVMPIFNALEPGLLAGVGFREAAVGAAVGTVGSIGGAAIRLVRPRKTINVVEHTR